MAPTKASSKKLCTPPPTGVSCPECRKGTLEPVRGRFGPNYKCTNKEDCKFLLHKRPTGAKCTYKRNGKKCGAMIVEGTKTIPDRCSDRECPFHNPHKLALKGRGADEKHA